MKEPRRSTATTTTTIVVVVAVLVDSLAGRAAIDTGHDASTGPSIGCHGVDTPCGSCGIVPGQRLYE